MNKFVGEAGFLAKEVMRGGDYEGVCPVVVVVNDTPASGSSDKGVSVVRIEGVNGLMVLEVAEG